MSMREKQYLVLSLKDSSMCGVTLVSYICHLSGLPNSLTEFGVPPRFAIRIRTWEAHRASQGSKPYTPPSFPIYKIRSTFASCPQYFWGDGDRDGRELVRKYFLFLTCSLSLSVFSFYTFSFPLPFSPLTHSAWFTPLLKQECVEGLVSTCEPQPERPKFGYILHFSLLLSRE